MPLWRLFYVIISLFLANCQKRAVGMELDKKEPVNLMVKQLKSNN